MKEIEIIPIPIIDKDKEFLDEFLKSQRIFQHYIIDLFRLPEELDTGQKRLVKQNELAKNRFELMDL